MRGAAFGRGGMVATAHPLASQTAARVLQEGGNAVDAAIAAAGVLAVALPPMNGLGGDAFLVHHDARSGHTTTLNGSGRVGAWATPAYLASCGYEEAMPRRGIRAAAVPGAVGLYLTALLRWGSKPLSALWAPAIELAREGLPVVRTVAARIHRSKELIDGEPFLKAMYMSEQSPLQAGQLLRHSDLAGTMQALAEAGPRAGINLFYRGELGRRIGEYVHGHGGLFGYEDMATHVTEECDPLTIEYRGWRIHETTPPSQGVIVLEMLGLLEGFNLAELPPCSADMIHLEVEAKKIAFFDRNRYLQDPKMTDARADHLLHKPFVNARRTLIRADAAAETELGSSPVGEDTTYLAVADGSGNCVSLITSLSNSFGAGVTVPGTGILLNNRAGRGFSLNPIHPNVLAPHKRTMHTLNCYLVERDGAPVLVGGTPGGDAQPQINVQVLVHLLDAGLDVQQAADAPRWQHLPGTDPSSLVEASSLVLETSLPTAVAEDLRSRGHPVKVREQLGGSVQLIAIDTATMTFAGGSDSRADGCALAPG